VGCDVRAVSSTWQRPRRHWQRRQSRTAQAPCPSKPRGSRPCWPATNAGLPRLEAGALYKTRRPTDCACIIVQGGCLPLLARQGEAAPSIGPPPRRQVVEGTRDRVAPRGPGRMSSHEGTSVRLAMLASQRSDCRLGLPRREWTKIDVRSELTDDTFRHTPQRPDRRPQTAAERRRPE